MNAFEGRWFFPETLNVTGVEFPNKDGKKKKITSTLHSKFAPRHQSEKKKSEIQTLAIILQKRPAHWNQNIWT